MQHYELLCIVPAKYSEEEAKQIMKKIAGLISGLGVKITKEDTLGILRLAYPVNNVYQGYYPFFEFDLEDVSALKELNRQLKLMTEILRFQIVTKDPADEESLKQAILKEKKDKLEKQREEQSPTKKEEKAAEAAPVKKVDMEELEAKLDKILDSDII